MKFVNFTYDGNIEKFKILKDKNIKYIFYSFDDFGFLVDFVVHNYNDKEKTVHIYYNNSNIIYSVFDINKKLKNKKYCVIRGDYVEFNRYLFENTVINEYINNFLDENKLTENILKKLPFPKEFTKENVDY